MTKACLVSAGGDPLLTMMVYQLFKKYWYDEVDRVYICFNTEMDRSLIPELFSRLIPDKKVSVIYQPHQLGYGEPIREMVHVAREDLLLLLEDDGFIYTPGIISEIFKGIENNEYDLAGSPRRSCTDGIWDRAKELFNLNYEGVGDKGPNFWPNFFFCKREDLLKTNQNFGSLGIAPGEYYEPLDYTFTEQQAGDTFVDTSLQLRKMGLRIKEIPQHKASPTEMEDRGNRTGNWISGKPPYIHGGSLSSGYSWNGFLLGRQPIVDKHETETRVAWWRIASEVEGFDEFKKIYLEGIKNLTAQLDDRLIETKYKIYKELL
ncbi:hypothetical protein M0R04_14245 [Candidatus Dojkabacteria bacterium]|jgi:hypothetical protein|nr:hypothetical protein [Candidatus Dojkabacteria bacterium]